MSYVQILIYVALAICIMILFLQSLYIQQHIQKMKDQSLQSSLLPASKLPNNVLRAYSVLGFNVITPAIDSSNSYASSMQLQLKRFTQDEARIESVGFSNMNMRVLPLTQTTSSNALFSDVASKKVQFVMLNGHIYRILTAMSVLTNTSEFLAFRSDLLNDGDNTAFKEYTRNKIDDIHLFLLVSTRDCNVDKSSCDGFMFSSAPYVVVTTANAQPIGFRLLGFGMQE